MAHPHRAAERTVLVQEHVPHDHELRVFVVGDRVIAFAVSKPAIGADLDDRRRSRSPRGDDPMTAARLARSSPTAGCRSRPSIS